MSIEGKFALQVVAYCLLWFVLTFIWKMTFPQAVCDPGRALLARVDHHDCLRVSLRQ